MPSFYNGKRFFLTYPQCNDAKEDLLYLLGCKAELSYYVIARELHEDGNPHLHCCVEFKETQRHGVDWLDLNGKHPNKQDPRSWTACQVYCKKDGDYIETPQDISIVKGGSELGLRSLCEGYDSQEEWYSYCVGEKISFSFAEFFWIRCHGDFATIIDGDTEGVMVPELSSLEFPQDGKCFVLVGDSGTGKTTWAKKVVPKPALFVSHIDELKTFRIGYHKSIIFDDVDFNHYPRTSQISIVDFDNPRAIHCRHAVARIPPGIFKIFTSNSDPLLLSDEAVRRRCRVVRMKSLK